MLKFPQRQKKGKKNLRYNEKDGLIARFLKKEEQL